MSSQNFLHYIKIYYEDTDAGGVVYHSKYLNFCERGRTEMMAHVGVIQQQLLHEDSVAFVVRNIHIDFVSPAKLDDQIVVITNIEKLDRTSVKFIQEIRRVSLSSGEESSYDESDMGSNPLICTLACQVVCVRMDKISGSFRLIKIPEKVIEKIKAVY